MAIFKKVRNHPRAVTVLVFSTILALLLRLTEAIITSPQSDPHMMRGLLVGLRELILSENFLHWYQSSPLAPIVIVLLYIAPFVGILCSVLVMFEIIPFSVQQPAHKVLPQKPINVLPPAKPSVSTGAHFRSGATKPPRSFSAAGTQPDLVSKEHAALQEACRNDGFNLTHNPNALVRVQIFDVKKEGDYILSWNQDNTATISVSGNVDIALMLDDQGAPYILGDPDPNDPHRQESYRLTLGKPLVLFRNNGGSLIRRYSITWIGGGPVC